MYDFCESLANAILDRSPDELIGAVMIALLLALAFAGIHYLAQRKAQEGRMLMIGLMIAANLSAMAIAGGFFVHARRGRSGPVNDRGHAFPGRPYLSLVETTFRTADENRDGFLSSEEAAKAAAEFVQRTDSTGKGRVDPASLELALPTMGFPHTRRLPGAPYPGPDLRRMGPRRGPRPRLADRIHSNDSASHADSPEAAPAPGPAISPESKQATDSIPKK